MKIVKLVTLLVLVISGCNNTNHEIKDSDSTANELAKSTLENDFQSLMEEIKSLSPEFEGKSIGIDPLVINWHSLPDLSDELKKQLNFDISDGELIKLHSYIDGGQELFYVITVHQFVDMDQAYHVGKLTTVKQNQSIGSMTVASFIDIYSQHFIATFFETDNEVIIEESIYPEPQEIAELNPTKDSLLVIKKWVDLSNQKILKVDTTWENL